MVTVEDVSAWLGLKPGQEDATLQKVVDATNAYVGSLPVVEGVADGAWPTDVELGGVMLASRLWRRRNSPAGVEAITEAGAQYVARVDIDIARLLQIDAMTQPGIG